MIKAFDEHRDLVQLFLKPAIILLAGLIAIIFMVIIAVQHIAHKATAKEQHAVTMVERKPVIAKAAPAPEAAQLAAPAPVAAPTPAPVAAARTIATPPAPAQTPVPASMLAPTVVISADGCTVTGTGTPGMTFNVGTTNGRKGGDSHYVIPASGTRTAHSGGVKDFTVYGQILGAANTQLAYMTGTITVASCPPADAE